jgi:hypothetical protein
MQGFGFAIGETLFEPHNIRSRMAAFGRLLPFTNANFWFGERPLLGDSGHSEKRHRSTDA